MSLKFDSLLNTNGIALLPCYGRVINNASHGSSDDWGPLYNEDTNSNFKVSTMPGLDSWLIVSQNNENRTHLLRLDSNFGLLHFAVFHFEDTAFLENGHECLFAANGGLHLLDVENKRVGTIARGDRFILLTDRYRKHL
jgi:hypothetical protein